MTAHLPLTRRLATDTITGQLHANNAPVSFATVLLLSAADSTVVSAVTSNEQGKFQFAGVQLGTYRVRASFVAYRTLTNA